MAVAVDEKMALMEELLKDENKVKEIFGASPEETRAKLADAGIVLEDDEFSAIMLGMNESEENLTEEQLNAVAGGRKKAGNFWRNVGQTIAKAIKRMAGPTAGHGRAF